MATINMPTPKKSGLEQIGEALGVAKSVYGIINDNDELQYKKALLQEDVNQKTNAFKKDWVEAQPTDTGATSMRMPGSQETALYKPRKEGDGSAPIKREDDLRGEYIKDPVKRNTDVILQANERINPQTKTPGFKRGVGDMAIIFSYMKILDPNSTVREGEYATAENAGGLSATLMNAYNKAIDGQKLTDDVRQSFIDHANSLTNAQLSQQKQVDDYYKQLAIDSPGVNFQHVIDPKYEKSYSKIKDKNKKKPEELLNAQAPAQAGSAPAPKPQTVIQNGHTYTLNPSTGNYE